MSGCPRGLPIRHLRCRNISRLNISAASTCQSQHVTTCRLPKKKSVSNLLTPAGRSPDCLRPAPPRRGFPRRPCHDRRCQKQASPDFQGATSPAVTSLAPSHPSCRFKARRAGRPPGFLSLLERARTAAAQYCNRPSPPATQIPSGTSPLSHPHGSPRRPGRPQDALKIPRQRGARRFSQLTLYERCARRRLFHSGFKELTRAHTGRRC